MGIKKTIPDSETAERVTDAEVIPKSIDTESALPEDIKQQIDDAIYDFMTYECKPPIEDMARARQPRWSACCMYIGQRVFKKIIRPRERVSDGKWVGIDVEKVNAIIPLWLYYCSVFDKTPLKADFGYFAGFSVSWLYDFKSQGVTQERLELFQRLTEIQENGIKGIITDGRANPTGNIVILNHDHGYATTTVAVQHETKQAIEATNLPKLGTLD